MWLGALEGYYGPPLPHAERVDLIGWLAEHGYDGYCYSPKDDPFHRDRWREPYPPAELARFAEVQSACRSAGLRLVLGISPGLDWRMGDPTEIDALVAKLAAFRELGVDLLTVTWDDVPGEGAVTGAVHGEAVAGVVDRMADASIGWMSCPVDYALAEPTAYLRAFAAALPEAVEVLWTGPSVVSPTLDAATVAAVRSELGRPVTFAENFPVNDLGMAQVLHLGPYPERDPAAVDHLAGVTVNLMSRSRASRIGLELAARFWRNPSGDRLADWRDVIAGHRGLEPLARGCRAWLADPGPDPELLEWAGAAGPTDSRLRGFLTAGCRTGLDPDLAAEVEPWLAQWDAEATAMLAALHLLERDRPPSIPALWAAAGAWRAAQRGDPQVFGTRFAMYPSTTRADERLVSGQGAVIARANLTDRLWERVLDQLPRSG
jgi:hyaluronoglucosaminidase